ncbi:MAG TPA: GNAT family N-acetyltransferase [Pseudolabrys sp.]|nr:GNAT family N-acetyltransferase [Pseudolabrys sp.]
MAEAIPARLDAHFAARADAERARTSPAAAIGDIRIAVYGDLAAIESEWRAFEPQADGTVFQCFDWLATWQRTIGARNGVQPAIVVGRDGAGPILFLLPLAVRAVGVARELTWLGSELCDYNGPLLAPVFSGRIDRARFLTLWQEITRDMQAQQRLRFDVIAFDKMPDMVGAQQNPMRYLGGAVNPSGAYLTHLSGDWEAFYTAARSSATRRRDRTKRKKLSEFGVINFVTPATEDDILSSLDTMMAQKARSFARMGVGNLFAKPGYADFFRALAISPATRSLVHVSRLDVGAAPAAVNLALVHRGRYYHLLASYTDCELSRFGPGAAHLHDLMHHAIDRGCAVFDFTIGDERYKRDWCDTELKLYDIIAPVTWRGALVATPKLAARRLKRWIKQTPVLWTIATKFREVVGGLRAKGDKSAGNPSD